MQEKRPLPVDVLESDGAYLIVFDAPGTSASDVQVRYVDDEVRVRIDRFRDFYDGFEMVIPGRGLALDGRVSLPDDGTVNPDAARATLTDRGTLEIEVPKVDGKSGDAGESSGKDGVDNERGSESDTDV